MVADFNGDGVPDLATANFATNDVSILLGDGHGKFRLSGVFGAGSGPASLVAADYDEDGAPDLCRRAQPNRWNRDRVAERWVGCFRNRRRLPEFPLSCPEISMATDMQICCSMRAMRSRYGGAWRWHFRQGYRFPAAASPLLLAFQDGIAAVDPAGVITVLARVGHPVPPDTVTVAHEQGEPAAIKASVRGLQPWMILATSPSITTLTSSANPAVSASLIINNRYRNSRERHRQSDIL